MQQPELPSAGWQVALKDARKTLKLSRARLAMIAGMSPVTVRAYETGKRRPSRGHLHRILDALQIEQGQRNRLLTELGYAPEGPPLASHTPGYVFNLEEAKQHVDEHPWPATVVNELLEIVAANQLAQDLWRVDLRREFTGPLERNLLIVASNPRFGDRVKNWDEALPIAIGVLKGHHRGPEMMPEGTSAYFTTVLERFFQGDPKYIARFLTLWENASPRDPKVRWSYPVVWEDPEAGTMRFKVLISTCNEPLALQFHDWIPLDAASWQALEQLKSRPEARDRDH